MKGQVLDLIMLFIIIAVIAVSLLLGSHIYYNGMQEKFPNSQIGNTSKTAVESTFQVFDYGLMMVMVGIGMATMISAFFIRSHPIFFIASLMILVIVIIVSAPISNALMGFATSDSISDESDRYPITVWILGNLPMIATVFGIIVIIALYAKGSGGGP